MQNYKKWIIVSYAVVTTLFSVFLLNLVYLRMGGGKFGFGYAAITFIVTVMVILVAGLRVRDL